MYTNTGQTEVSQASTGKLLIVTYHFPPIVSAGVFRLIGFVRHLHRRGWKITVLTVTDSPVERHDTTNLALIPEGVKVIRTSSLEIDRLLHRRGAEKSTSDDGPAVLPGPRSEGQKWARRARRVLKLPFLAVYRLLTYPDKRAGWILPMVIRLARLVRNDPDIIVLSSSPPHSSQMGVLLARCLVRFRWIADFRDPWTAPSQKKLHPWSFRYQRLWERWVLERCDGIIANTPGNFAMLRRELPALKPDKIAVITNGFDDADDSPLPVVSRDKLDCDLVYVGEVYEGMLGLWVEVLTRLKATGGERIPRLHIFGSVADTESERIAAAGLAQHIVYKGFVSYRESVAIMREAPALLVLLEHAPRWKTTVPSKVYGYVFSGRPVLALVPEGDAARILDLGDQTTVVTSNKLEVVTSAVTDFINRSTTRPGRRPPSATVRQELSYEALTNKLEAVFHRESN